jgi:hypothetical protein
MDRKQSKRPAQGSRKNPGSKRPSSRIADALGGEKVKGASAIKERISLTQDLGGRAVGWGPGSPSPSYLLGRRAPARPRSEMPIMTISGRNRPTLVSRLPDGASSGHDAATAIMARPSGTSPPNPMSQLADRMENSELLSDRSELDPAYITDHDLEMASRQTRIESLSPDQRQEVKNKKLGLRKSWKECQQHVLTASNGNVSKVVIVVQQIFAYSRTSYS